MSDTQTTDDEEPFRISIDEETTLGIGDELDHEEWGPMEVKSIRAGRGHKTAKLSALSRPDGLTIDMSAEDMREGWGDTVHTDPEEVLG